MQQARNLTVRKLEFLFHTITRKASVRDDPMACCFFFLIFLPLTFSLSPTSAYRWRCPPGESQIVNEVLGIFGRDLDIDRCQILRVYCNRNTSVVEGLKILNAPDFNGTIPPAIGQLSNLQTLILHNIPNLHGGFPPSLAGLTKLRSLTITWTNLTGPIPTWLGRFTNLEWLDLSHNQLAGSIPASLAGLSIMYFLNLGRNQLSGRIPESLGRLRSLTQIYLPYNQLSGSVPNCLGDLDLLYIQLQRNRLVGDPSHLFNNRTKQLATVDLSRNQFSFDLTDKVFPLTLGSADLSHNMIYGSIPFQFTEIQLYAFNVSYNRLCGRIPLGPHWLELFDGSFIHNKCLCGPPLNVTC